LCESIQSSGFILNQNCQYFAQIHVVLAVLIPDKPGGLDALTQLLHKERINVNNAYGFVLESSKSAVFVVDVDQMKKTEKLLEENGFKTLDTRALSAM